MHDVASAIHTAHGKLSILLQVNEKPGEVRCKLKLIHFEMKGNSSNFVTSQIRKKHYTRSKTITALQTNNQTQNNVPLHRLIATYQPYWEVSRSSCRVHSLDSPATLVKLYTSNPKSQSAEITTANVTHSRDSLQRSSDTTGLERN